MSDLNETTQLKKCGRCKMTLPISKFDKKRNDAYKKTCNHCLTRGNEYYRTNRCPHGLYIYNCQGCSVIRKTLNKQKGVENDLKI